MKKKFLTKVLAGVLGVCMAVCISPIPARADNPIVQTNYTADPSPMVYNGTMYLYTSHDEDEDNGFYNMLDWKCYSSTDMVNWTDHGTVMSYVDFSWTYPEEPRAWAPQCVERDGKFYLYCPLRKKDGGIVIGVGVSDSPTGPFVEAIDKPLVDEGDWNDIDPTVYVDDDGQAYLYFGNPNLRYVKLNDDMISYDGELELSDELLDAGYTVQKGVVRVAMTEEAFGPGRPAEKPEDPPSCSYTEGPWFYKRNNHYYMVFAAFGPEGGAEHFAYSMSDSPEGPWEYKGILMDSQGLGDSGTSYTNHPGLADYMGHSYLFYHNQALPGGHSFRRSVCVDEFSYNDDGTIPKSVMTLEGPEAVRPLNPYERTEAETIAWEENVETEGGPREENWDGQINLCDIKNGSYVKVKNVDFGEKGAIKFNAAVAKGDDSKAAIELHLDSVDGTQIGQLDITNTGGEEEYKTLSTDVSGATGEHDLYLVFTGDESEDSSTLFKFDYWQFEKEPEPEQPPAPTQSPAPVSPSTPTTPTVQPPAASVTPPAPHTDVLRDTDEDDVSVGKVKRVSVKKQKGNKAKLSWKKVKGADGYRIVYSTDKKLKKSVKRVSTSKTSCTLKKLSRGKKYFVKVQAYKKDKKGKKVYGSYSAVKKFKA